MRCMTMALVMSLVLWRPASPLSPPQSVPKLTERSLDKVSYVELARRWRDYIEQAGESAHALVNLAMAYYYSGEKTAAAKYAKRAVEIDPDHPQALALYGKLLSKNEQDLAEALQLLVHCRQVTHRAWATAGSFVRITNERGVLSLHSNVPDRIVDREYDMACSRYRGFGRRVAVERIRTVLRQRGRAPRSYCLPAQTSGRIIRPLCCVRL